MKWVGLTGGIATGKSSVSELLKKAAIPVVDADELARFVVSRGSPGLRSIVTHFGQAYLNPDGSLNREKLGQRIFSSPADRKVLESLTHPLIHEERDRRKAELEEAGHEVAVYDIPLLFEAQAQTQFDRIAVVYCSPEQQRERLRRRHQWTEAQINDRLAAQISINEKVKQAQFVIDNSGDEEQLKSEVDRFVVWLRALS